MIIIIIIIIIIIVNADMRRKKKRAREKTKKDRSPKNICHIDHLECFQFYRKYVACALRGRLPQI